MPRKRLGEMLIAAGLLSADRLTTALKEQERWGGHLGQILVDRGFVDESALVQALSQQLNIPVVEIDAAPISKKVLARVPEELADRHTLIPFQQQGKFLDVAMSNPMDMGIIDEIRIRSQLNVRPFIAGPTAIRRAIRHNYGVAGSPARPDYRPGVATVQQLESARIHRPDATPTPMPRRATTQRPITEDGSDVRGAEIAALQRRLLALEALVARDENVIRKLLMLLVEKGVASRDEILAAIK